jgi:hypothetical protein
LTHENTTFQTPLVLLQMPKDFYSPAKGLFMRHEVFSLCSKKRVSTETAEMKPKTNRKEYLRGYRLGLRNTPFSFLPYSKSLIRGWGAAQHRLYKKTEPQKVSEL